MVQNVQSIIKRKRFVSYSKYVGHVKQAVNEINVDMNTLILGREDIALKGRMSLNVLKAKRLADIEGK